ncbi:MAG: DUF1993 domain-containing protein [Bosea sp. (in: a-proteobacteria)]|nr:DUF1993 domain-containing protein [Bosea sp. (in: a-proteobacteria)]
MNSLSHLIDKAIEAALDENELMEARLAPDMLPFSRQIQLACDFAKNAAARLAGGDNPKHPDDEKSFDELKARIAKVLAFVEGIDEAAFEAGVARDITFPRGQNATMTMRGEAYLTRFAVPNFYFHATTAYAILRKNGIQIGKQDFLLGVFEA